MDRFQSTHPHGVRLLRAPVQKCVPLVSIHAPARGATGWNSQPCPLPYIVSIHAPARGATYVRTILQDWVNKVSIHAPARGATSMDLSYGRIIIGFNPRTRTGCDQLHRLLLRPAQRFNPRTRTGCDGGIGQSSKDDRSFNPRTRTGCDLQLVHFPLRPDKFQSTHPHGVRPH